VARGTGEIKAPITNRVNIILNDKRGPADTDHTINYGPAKFDGKRDSGLWIMAGGGDIIGGEYDGFTYKRKEYEKLPPGEKKTQNTPEQGRKRIPKGACTEQFNRGPLKLKWVNKPKKKGETRSPCKN